MQDKFDLILQELKDIKVNVSNLNEGQEHLQKDVKEIKESVHRIELSQPKDIVALLKQMNKNMEDKTDVLNKRIFNTETAVERLNRQ